MDALNEARISNRRIGAILSGLLTPTASDALASRGWSLPAVYRARHWELISQVGDARLGDIDREVYFAEIARENAYSGFLGDPRNRWLHSAAAYRSAYLDRIPLEVVDPSRPDFKLLLPEALMRSRLIEGSVDRQRKLSALMFAERWPGADIDQDRYDLAHQMEAGEIVDALQTVGADCGWSVDKRRSSAARTLRPLLAVQRGALTIRAGMRHDKRRMAIGILDPYVELSMGTWSAVLPHTFPFLMFDGAWLYGIVGRAGDVTVAVRFLLDLLGQIAEFGALEAVDAVPVQLEIRNRD